jgi:hypothetical protein
VPRQSVERQIRLATVASIRCNCCLNERSIPRNLEIAQSGVSIVEGDMNLPTGIELGW